MSLPDKGAVKRKLPIGIQTFRLVREEGCYYVDKTAFIGRLMDGGKHYFLSRPRRFGKSLLLDTIKDRGYAEKYRHLGQPIHLIGVEFSQAERNIAAFEVERAA